MPNAVHWNTKAGKLYAESVQTHLRRKNRKEGIIIMYNAASKRAEEFIDHEEILASIQFAQENKNNRPYIESLIERAADCRGLNHREAMALWQREGSRMQATGTSCPSTARRISPTVISLEGRASR